MASLKVVEGIGEAYENKLKEIDITSPELAMRKPENLLAKMIEVNEQKKLIRGLPVLKQVQKWVNQAKTLPRIIQY